MIDMVFILGGLFGVEADWRLDRISPNLGQRGSNGFDISGDKACNDGTRQEIEEHSHEIMKELEGKGND